LIRVALLFLAVATLVLWSWNTVMPEIFELPSIHYKHATALVILIGTISLLLHTGRAPVRRCHGNLREQHNVRED
jgi:hypothetical protein